MGQQQDSSFAEVLSLTFKLPHITEAHARSRLQSLTRKKLRLILISDLNTLTAGSEDPSVLLKSAELRSGIDTRDLVHLVAIWASLEISAIADTKGEYGSAVKNKVMHIRNAATRIVVAGSRYSPSSRVADVHVRRAWAIAEAFKASMLPPTTNTQPYEH